MPTIPRLLAFSIFALLAAAPALAYTGGGTFVVKSGSNTLFDNGGVVCHGLTGDGIGGGCLPLPFQRGPPQPGNESDFGTPGFIGVNDNTAGTHVAFQVCLDNNGDGVCGGDFAPGDKCRDQIFFSHADGGKFFDPLGPLPGRTLFGCPQAFQGYVVLLCTGTHNDDIAGPHTHTLTTGVIFAAQSGSGYGNFCGGGFGGAGGPTGFVNAAAKAYRVD